VQEQTDHDVVRLYPQPAKSKPLAGLYLEQDLRAQSEGRTQPFLYANFVHSLDGRIAVPDKVHGGLTVPSAVANKRDWRLFQELAVQADIIITTGRYLRDYAAGKAQEILRIHDDPIFADLVQWRDENGLPPQPDLAVVSSSLDFPIPQTLSEQKRRVIVVTDSNADADKVEDIKRQLGEIVVVDTPQDGEGVDGHDFLEALAAHGYRTIYSAAGPRILHMLLVADVLDRLFLTTVPRILGGDPFAAITDGPLLDTPVDMTLRTLFLDTAGVDGLGQLFACYERTR
jgi:riboflavin biosynthesis pyrimidine reductase